MVEMPNRIIFLCEANLGFVFKKTLDSRLSFPEGNMEAMQCVPMHLASTAIVMCRVTNKVTFMMFLDLFLHEFWEMWDTLMFKSIYRHFGG
jgi:hypothetical protein